MTLKYNLNAAVGGLNLIDPLDNMAPEYAIQMDNVIPDSDGDRIRTGYISCVSGNYKRLIPVPFAGHEKLIACKDGTVDVYDPTNWETAPTQKTGYASDNWVSAIFTDGSGTQHLFMANGLDVPIDYTTGGGVVASTFTIPAGVKLDSPLSFKNTMYFVGGDWDIYYGGTQAISGTLNKFSVGSFFKKGGKILTIQNWTQDAGQGMNDIFVIISTEGEVMLYQGSNPTESDWSSLGVFTIPRPIGKRCCEMVGADIIIMTENGYLPLSSVLSDLRANRTAISGKINPIVRGKNFTLDWEIHFYSKKGFLFINAPSSVAGYSHEQHVLNINTNAWCRFVGMDGQSWAVLFDNLYFCNANGIFQADQGQSDNGDWIVYTVQRAYNTFGTPEKKQLMRMVPRFTSFSNNTIYKRINSDFKIGKNRIITTNVGTGYVSYWDTAIWDVNFWSDESEAYTTRASVQSRTGSFISVGLYGRTKDELKFTSTGLMLKVCEGHL